MGSSELACRPIGRAASNGRSARSGARTGHCARPPGLAIFEREHPDDHRPRLALDVAQAFADGAKRTTALRDGAWAAQRAAHDARDAGHAAGSEAARAALVAAGAAFLHPLVKATQVKHIVGAAALAVRALEPATPSSVRRAVPAPTRRGVRRRTARPRRRDRAWAGPCDRVRRVGRWVSVTGCGLTAPGCSDRSPVTRAHALLTARRGQHPAAATRPRSARGRRRA